MPSPNNPTDYTPKQFHLQWHITQRCNLRCTHCYQENYKNTDLPFKDLVKIVDQFKEALKSFSQKNGQTIKGHITVTGGEPFIRKDFFDLLALFAKNNAYFTFSILTNGTLINEETAEKIKLYGPTYVQVSVEGKKETHDLIRGNGSYEKTTSAIKYLLAQKIPTVVSFTAHKKNFQEFKDVVDLSKKLGVNRVWSDRIIPCGSGEAMKELQLSAEETKIFFELMKQEKIQTNDRFCKTEVAMHRALQFLCGGKPYVCQAGKSLITIDTNADMYPCRRMPIKVGNVLESDIISIYNNSELFKKLQNPNQCESKCISCTHFNKCQGGLKCLSYATTGNPFIKDPGCWIKT